MYLQMISKNIHIQLLGPYLQDLAVKLKENVIQKSKTFSSNLQMWVYTSYWPPSEKKKHSCQYCRIFPRVGELVLAVSCMSCVGTSSVFWCSVTVPAVPHTGQQWYS